jgi:ribosomal protein S12 methylthiotransferase
MKTVLREEILDEAGEVVQAEVAILWGGFVQAIFDFLIIALALFIVMRVASALNTRAKKIREKVEGVTIRTTFIAGFPGETEEEFDELCEFVEEMRFERMGCFAYSEEEGTPASKLDGMLEPEIREDRANIINERQSIILDELNESLIGERLEVIVEGYDSYNDAYFGRTTMDAPEIDMQIFFTSDEYLDEGALEVVEVINVIDGELIGELV